MGPWTHQCLTAPDENGQDAFLAGVCEGLARGGVWGYVGGFKGLGFNWGLGVAFEDYIGKPKSCLYCSMICTLSAVSSSVEKHIASPRSMEGPMI